MKFSVPGHSCIQKVDSVHSVIERSLRKSEYFSPLSLIRVLLEVNFWKPYNVLQMKEQDFLDFSWYSSKMNYNIVSFSKVVALEFSKSFIKSNTGPHSLKPIINWLVDSKAKEARNNCKTWHNVLGQNKIEFWVDAEKW